ncbi:unnamed protein product [Closterium sp. Naga37s-1]|nr:unnamed protein product [Closterium sp. Naga37s-1]
MPLLSAFCLLAVLRLIGCTHAHVEPGLEHAMSLSRAWEAAYGLQGASPTPPAAVALPPNVPPAPHLEACSARSAWRRAVERRGAQGEAPGWAWGAHPQPPWAACHMVRVGMPHGAGWHATWCGLARHMVRLACHMVRVGMPHDASNLGRTREAQRDIWQHQLPAGDCSTQRLLVIDWPASQHGLGSQLHIMSAALSLAMQHSRVLVPTASFDRANHADHTQIAVDVAVALAPPTALLSIPLHSWLPLFIAPPTGALASFHCYFFPLVSPHCERAAADAAAAGQVGECASHEAPARDSMLASERRVVCFHGEPYSALWLEAAVAKRWWGAWYERPNTVEVKGKMAEEADVMPHCTAAWHRLVVHRSMASPGSAPQLLSYVLRAQVHRTFRSLSCLVHTLLTPFFPPPHASLTPLFPSPHASLSLCQPGQQACTLEATAWARQGLGQCAPTRTACSAAGAGSSPGSSSSSSSRSSSSSSSSSSRSGGGDGSRSDSGSSSQPAEQAVDGAGEGEAWGSEWGEEGAWEAYLPRPIVSMHVRQSDKGGEMALHSLAAHMWMAYRLRLALPHLRHIWLSSEMQTVIDEAAQYRDWTFLHSSNARTNVSVPHWDVEEAAGRHVVVGSSLAELLTAAQCDFFIGAMGSNWVRMINELRSTNGRLLHGFIALNIQEF